MDNTQEQSQKLFVGAKVYHVGNYAVIGVFKIARTTATQAISDTIDVKFKLEIDANGRVKRIGADQWNMGSYYLETPELKQKLWRQNAISKCSNADFSKLTNEQLQAILNIINA